MLTLTSNGSEREAVSSGDLPELEAPSALEPHGRYVRCGALALV